MAYAPPQDDTAHFISDDGATTWTDAAALNGGGVIESVFIDDGTHTKYMSATGGPIRTATCAFTTATKNLNGTDIGNGVTEGTLCYVSTGDGAHITVGIYEITTVTDNDNIICADIDDDGSNDTGVTVNVGGVIRDTIDGFGTLQNILDAPEISTTGGFTRTILIGGDETIGATIVNDQNSGLANNHVIVKGVNKEDWTFDGTQPVITTGVVLADGLVTFATSMAYTEWHNIDFDANSVAVFAINMGAISVSGHLFNNCLIHHATSNGLNCASSSDDRNVVAHCDVYSNGGDGIDLQGDTWLILACSIHDNTDEGIEVTGHNTIIGCTIYDNTDNGIVFGSSSDGSHISFCTVFGNGDSGIGISSGSMSTTVSNCTSVGNGTAGSGYGYFLSAASILGFFGYNHSSGNQDGHSDQAVGDAAFQTFRQGNNRTGDPKFTDADGGNFKPLEGSDLIDNGLDAS